MPGVLLISLTVVFAMSLVAVALLAVAFYIAVIRELLAAAQPRQADPARPFAYPHHHLAKHGVASP